MLPVDASATQEQLMEVSAHDRTGLALKLIGLVDLAAVVWSEDSLRRYFSQFGGRRLRIVWFAPFHMRMTWSAGWCCSLLRRSPFEARVSCLALLTPALHGRLAVEDSNLPCRLSWSYLEGFILADATWFGPSLQDLLHREACLIWTLCSPPRS